MKTILTISLAAGLTSLLPGGLSADMALLRDKPLRDKLYGAPVGGDVVHLQRADTVEMYFIVNNTKDRVGVYFEACVDPSGGTDRNCEDLTFYFPALTYNKKNHEILLNGERVAKSGGSLESMEIFEPFALGYEVEKKLIDSGFDKHVRARIKVYLGRK